MSREVLVLNHNYQPLNVTNWRRAFALLYLGKAHVVDEAACMPSVVRLTHHVKRPMPILRPTRRSIFTRDGHRCVYCGATHLPLTIDHVTPRVRGGRDEWENLVCCCTVCNNSKGDRSPDEAGMTLRVKPRRPKCLPYISYHKFMVALRNPEWQDYLAPYAPEGAW
jgi:5-methylcytosine-specific restriction endonuclease McrA